MKKSFDPAFLLAILLMTIVFGIVAEEITKKFLLRLAFVLPFSILIRIVWKSVSK